MARKLNVPLPSLGLVVDRPGEFTDARAVTNIKNMEFDRSVIHKRIGASEMGDALAERVQRVLELQVGGSTRLMRIGPTRVEAYSKSTDVWASIIASPLTGAAEDMISYGFAVLAGVKIAVFTNGIDPIKKVGITGNVASLGGAPPKARFIRQFGDYTVIASVIDGGDDFRSRVQWPDTGAPEVWTGGNAGSQELNQDQEDITGLGVFGGALTVHKSKSIYLGSLVSTSGVFHFERRNTGAGTVSEASIQNLPSGEQIFLAADGIRIFNGITAPLVDSPIQDELRDGMNPAYAYKAQSVFVAERDEYWVCVAMGSDTEPQTVYKYNYRTRQMYKDTRTNLTALGLFLNTQEDSWDDDDGTWDSDTTRWDSVENLSLNPVVILGYSNGKTLKRTSNTNDDDGMAVEGLWETKDFGPEDFDLADMDRMLRWKGLEVWAKGTAVTAYYSVDGGTVWAQAKVITLEGDYPTDAAPINVFFDKVSSRMRFRLVNSTLGGSFTLKKYQIEAVQREARK